MSTFFDTQGDSVEVYTAAAEGILSPETAAFYRAMVEALRAADLPFLVGGAYAFARYTGIERHTKDFDVFVRKEDVDQAMTALAAAGCATELTFPHWLGKAYCGADFIDVIFSSGNGLVRVDEGWFANAVDDEVLGLPVRLVPPEEMLWSKAFVMERERYDGADVNHLLRTRAADLDWPRLLQRFGEHWPVLLSHLVLFAYVYPAEASNVPDWVIRELLERAPTVFHSAAVADCICRGPLVSRAQYLTDIEAWGYHDPRLYGHGGSMTRAEVDDWTEAIEQDG